MSSYLESAVIKKPHQKMSYTPEQLQEFAKCADPVTGPHYFLSNYFYVQCKGKIKYKPYSYQDKLIDVYHNNRWSISLLPRQSGKCLTKDMNITIRNKKKEVYVIPIGVFYEYEFAKRNGTELPDISNYRQGQKS